MKKLVSILLTVSIAAVALAQPQQQQGRKDFRDKSKGIVIRNEAEKFKAERVAFITSEVGLTAEDAQAFWPVYNKAEAEQKELNVAEKKAYIALTKALADGQGNVDALLDAYIKAKQANVNKHIAYTKEYKKAIGTEKTAKFFASEEKFRMKQFHKLADEYRKNFGAPGHRNGRGPGKDFKGDQGFKPDQDGGKE
ncbi:MAG: hypothetical protein J5740_06665 [Bacteroidales bacterium]|nr:hypothetical protein [Bacteroidales bacterium]